MNHLVLAAAALTLAVAAVPANAQAPLRANERYCLLAYDNTGPNPLLCRFETMEQCYKSRAGNTDQCLINPELAFQQQRINRR
jgi:hypothetical protein